ncbi:WD repeat-containing protein on Y chromosome-like, partial [Drosophila sechellia]|uniref:WD repeat-containing protein on Y chromosome-like n=1 Tax=Drosophila sechellia TaxID=7238 RepID=UPI0013DDDC2F
KNFLHSIYILLIILNINHYFLLSVPESEKIHVCMPKLRLEFIFLRKELFMTRAKRAVRNQAEPLLVSSYKGHLKAINSIAFINLPKIIFTGSHDYSCRLWTQGGRYLGTLGTVLPWSRLTPFERAGDDNHLYRMPPDIKKVASSTTLKVISGLQAETSIKISKGKAVEDREEDTGQTEDATELRKLLDKPVKEPIVGKHFELPGRSVLDQHIELDTTQSYIAVFTQLKVHSTEMLERLPTPAVVSRVQAENYMDHYIPVEGKVDVSGSAINIKQPLRRRSDKASDTHNVNTLGARDLVPLDFSSSHASQS